MLTVRTLLRSRGFRGWGCCRVPCGCWCNGDSGNELLPPVAVWGRGFAPPPLRAAAAAAEEVDVKEEPLVDVVRHGLLEEVAADDDDDDEVAGAFE